MDFARGLGIRGKKNGYLENDRYIVTWAVGHLVELFEPQDYNPAWKKWSFEHLPVIPDTYRYKPIKMNGSRAATIRLKDLFSIGRVQTAVLALLLERRKVRDDFTPQPYWLVKGTFRGEKGTYALSL